MVAIEPSDAAYLSGNTTLDVLIMAADAAYMSGNTALDVLIVPADAAYMSGNTALDVLIKAADAAYMSGNTALNVLIKAADAAYMSGNTALDVLIQKSDAAYLSSNVVPGEDPPPVPVVTARLVNRTDVQFNWNSTDFIENYEWEGAIYGTGPQKTATIADATPGVEYTLRVRALHWWDYKREYVYSDWGYAIFKMPGELTQGLRKPPSQRNPEFTDKRQGQALEAMVPGSLSGRVANASPVGGTGSPGAAGIIGTGTVPDGVFSHPGPIVENAISGPYRVAGTELQVTGIHATLGTVGTTDTTLVVLKNEATWVTVTIPAGQKEASVAVTGSPLAVDTVLKVNATAVGTKAQDLVVQLRTG